MKRFFGFLMLVLFSFSLLTGCGSSDSNPESNPESNSEGSSESSLESNSDNNSDRKWSDTDVIDAYGTVDRNGEQINVCVCHDQKAVYLYYDNDEHELFAAAKLPMDEIYDDDWLLGNVSFYNSDFDGSSCLEVYLHHSDMSESNIVWSWEEGKGFVYQPGYSRFYYPIVIYDPLEGAANCDYSMYEGLWLSDADNVYENTYLQFDDIGGWQLYVDNEVIDEGYLQYDEEESLIYARGYRNSAVADGFIRMEDDRLNISTCGYFSCVDEG